MAYGPDPTGRRPARGDVGRGSGPCPERLEVEVALDPRKHLVTDDPVVAERDHGLALRLEDRVADLLVLEQLELLLVPRALPVGSGVARLVLVARAEIVEERLVRRIAPLEIGQPPQCCL